MKISKNVLVWAMASLFALPALAQQGERKAAPRAGQRLEHLRERMAEVRERVGEMRREIGREQAPERERAQRPGIGRKGAGENRPPRRGGGREAKLQDGRGPHGPRMGGSERGRHRAALTLLRDRLRQMLHRVESRIGSPKGGDAVGRGAKAGPRGPRAGRGRDRRGDEA